ncbi:MAG: hypothetical protein O6703_05430, partial [Gammaproteobacteria bacterium]|nr:hypothetical protein [Gammaproteobacteria bacterium]
LVIATIMMLFIKGSKTRATPGVVSGIVALVLFELEAANYLVLLLSVAAGVMAAVIQERHPRA